MEKAKTLSSTAGRTQVVIADDDPSILSLMNFTLCKAGFVTLTATNGEEAMALMTEEVSAAVLDLRMPRMNGHETLVAMRKAFPDVQVMLITAHGDIKDAVESMKAGAFDYITKPFIADELVSLVQQAARTCELGRENRQLRQTICPPQPNRPFVGRSAVAQDLQDKIARIAELDATILITGESGCGKGLLARLIHQASPRARQPFINVNCTALPRDLVEAELFGHERGAFTGAHERRPGRVEMAKGGTLLLDEIGDMPLELQPKLLQFLQERTFMRVGGSQELSSDVRIVAATNVDLKALCRERRFREDLYFRLNVLLIEVPPLRARKADILLLADHILIGIARRRAVSHFELADDVRALFSDYPWPGNVREMENTLERATAFCKDGLVRLCDLPSEFTQETEARATGHAGIAGRPLREIERMAIEQTLDLCRGNKAKAARTLGISEKSIYNKMDRLGISFGREQFPVQGN